MDVKEKDKLLKGLKSDFLSRINKGLGNASVDHQAEIHNLTMQIVHDIGILLKNNHFPSYQQNINRIYSKMLIINGFGIVMDMKVYLSIFERLIHLYDTYNSKEINFQFSSFANLFQLDTHIVSRINIEKDNVIWGRFFVERFSGTIYSYIMQLINTLDSSILKEDIKTHFQKLSPQLIQKELFRYIYTLFLKILNRICIQVSQKITLTLLIYLPSYQNEPPTFYDNSMYNWKIEMPLYELIVFYFICDIELPENTWEYRVIAHELMHASQTVVDFSNVATLARKFFKREPTLNEFKLFTAYRHIKSEGIAELGSFFISNIKDGYFFYFYNLPRIALFPNVDTAFLQLSSLMHNINEQQVEESHQKIQHLYEARIFHILGSYYAFLLFYYYLYKYVIIIETLEPSRFYYEYTEGKPLSQLMTKYNGQERIVKINEIFALSNESLVLFDKKGIFKIRVFLSLMNSMNEVYYFEKIKGIITKFSLNYQPYIT
ncbi:MAG: hypothetical protein V1859_04650 [archaeon]